MSMAPEINERMPDFELPSVRGGTVRLSHATRERTAVLVFYRGGWCPICSTQLASLSTDYEAFRRLGAEIIAISNEEVEKGLELLKKAGPPFLLLQDPKSELLRTLGLVVQKRDPLGVMLRKHEYAIPAVFIVDHDRVVRWKYVGKDYKDRPANATILEALAAVTAKEERAAFGMPA